MIEALKVPNRQAEPIHADFEHLIEVAIVKHSVPSNAHERPAHQAGNDRRIEVLDQQFHVVRAFFIAVQEVGEALDWHVRKSEQSMKLDGEVLAEVALVLSLQAALIGRQTCAQRVYTRFNFNSEPGMPYPSLLRCCRARMLLSNT